MWFPKIFSGLTYREHVFLTQNFSVQNENTTPYMTPEALVGVRNRTAPQWQQTAYADWRGNRNEHGMPVGREGYSTQSAQHSQEQWQNLIHNCSPEQYEMLAYCVDALTRSGEVAYSDAVSLLANSIASGATIPNLYDLIRRGVPSGYATEMLRAFPLMQQADAAWNEAKQHRVQGGYSVPDINLRLTADMSGLLDELHKAGEAAKLGNNPAAQARFDEIVDGIKRVAVETEEQSVHVYPYVLSQSEVDSEFQKQTQENAQKIAQVFGVSAAELGLSDDESDEEIKNIMWRG